MTPLEDALKEIQAAEKNKNQVFALYSKGLHQIPPDIGNLTELTELGLSFNYLTDLPDTIKHLTKLRNFWISNNYLTQFPLVITKLESLQRLSLTYNFLNNIPQNIKELKNLTSLYLHDNELKTVPAEIGQLSELKILEMDNNHIETIPIEILNLPKLQMLNLRNNNIRNLPSEINLSDKLAVLDLRDNPISDTNIGNLVRKYEGLYIDYYVARSIPEQLLEGELRHIFNYLTANEKILDKVKDEIKKAEEYKKEELDLSYLEFKELPSEIGRLVNLKFLNLTNNELTTLPEEIGELKNLEVLSLRGNLLQSLPVEIGNLKNLKKLDLNKNQLKDIPAEIGKLTKLEMLILKGNKITSLPDEIGNLSNLKKIVLESNKLETLPSTIGNLINLESLYLRDNKLEDLPEEMSQLINLQRLYIEGNKLKSFPNQILQLSNLERLALDNNSLESIPQMQLEKLKRLSLTKNKLQQFSSIADRNNLLLLDLRDNPCIDKFIELSFLKKQGTGIYTTNNIVIPDEMLNAESWEVWHYLLNLINTTQPSRKLNEVKLLLVGEGDVGKTSLVERLLSNTFSEHNRTEGINIVERKFWVLGKHNNKIRVNIWDFGGQEIMHTTHQFFLTKRSVYIIVIDARRGEQESRLEYWLKIVQSFGGDSPIIVAINKCDQNPASLNTRFLEKKYPSIRSFCDISCKTGDGVDKLRTQITEQIDSLKEVNAEFPESWFKLKEELENLKCNYISSQDYEKYCKDHQITKPDDQKALLNLLHYLGVMLNYQDGSRDDPRLVEINVLKPEWVTSGVYKILNNNALFQAHGILHESDLRDILDDPNYSTYREHLFIIELMRKFELSFPFENQKTYLIPDLLPKKEPDLNWNEQDSLAFQYHYDVLPASVISRFIVRMNHYISKETCWRTGVVLNDKNDINKALIRADIEDKKIYIFVNGSENTRRDFLAMIRGHFEDVHSDIKCLKISEKIPYKTALFDYQHLLKLERLGENFIIPEGGLEERIPIAEVLSGIRKNKDNNKIDTKKFIFSISIFSIFGDKAMSILKIFKIRKVGKGAIVQQGVDGDATTTKASESEKQSIWTNALIVVAGIIVLIILSANFLCYNKIISSKSCEKLFIVLINKASSLGTEDKNNQK